MHFDTIKTKTHVQKIKKLSQNLYDYVETLDNTNTPHKVISIFKVSEEIEVEISKIHIFTPKLIELAFEASQIYCLLIAEKDIITLHEQSQYHFKMLSLMAIQYIRLVEKYLKVLEDCYIKT